MDNNDILEQSGELGEITPWDILINSILVRLNSLSDILRGEAGMETEIMILEGGYPRIEADYEGRRFYFGFIPVDEKDPDRCIFFILSDAALPDAGEDENEKAARMLAADSFNVGSTFGHAVYDPERGSVSLRANIPELGGMSESEWYRYCFELFVGSLGELEELLKQPAGE